MNECDDNEIRHTEIPTAEPPELKPAATDYEIDAEILIGYKSPGTNQVLSELIQSGSKQDVLRFPEVLIAATWNR